MGLINDTIKSGLNTVGLGSLTSKSTKAPSDYGPDFPEGFQIIEYVDGRAGETITLSGSFMPIAPFNFGGTQQIVKEYYPGNSEPTVQVLGPRENDVTIKGSLKLKRIKDESYRELAVEMQKQIEAMRLRGNLVKIKLREWYRYAFIESASFDYRQKTDIGYEINFSVIGFNIPKNSMFLGSTDEDPVVPNKQLTARAAELFAQNRQFPESMPQDITDILNSAINDVAEAVGLVTGFVDGILSDVEALNRGANRALGLIKNARASISQTSRRVGQIVMTSSNLGSSFVTEANKTAAMIRNANHIHKIQGNNSSLSALLVDLQNRFRNMVGSIPFKRHLVRSGDTLQKISTIYYNTPDYWEQIQKHNRLVTTDLEIGKVLEIPRV